MILPPQREPVRRHYNPPATPRQPMIVISDGRQMPMMRAIHLGLATRRDKSACVR
jgi:hypothetical protein